MKLNEIRDNDGARKSRTRVGRGIGSGKGKTGGRGYKGQKSRSGVSLLGFEGGQMPLYRRLPKKGFSNSRFKTRYDVINVGQLEGLATGTKVDLALLEKEGLVKPRHGKLKILGEGELSVALEVHAARCSASARAKIEQAGGKVEVG